MLEWFSSPLFGVALSILAYVSGVWVNKKLRSPAANPLLIAVVLVIIFLKLTGIPLEAYQAGGNFIGMFLAPATACLAVSIYSQIHLLKKNLLPILAGSAAGSAASMASVWVLCRLFRLDESFTASLLAEQLGGSAPITVAAVIFTGILGAMLVPAFLKLFRVKDPVAAGLAIGACSHAIGTSKALEIGEAEGAMSSIAIGACGLITVLFSMFLR